MARYKIECCYNCQKRCPGCHSTCEDYKTQKTELDETMAAQRNRNETKNNLNRALFDTIHKCTKRVQYRSKYRRPH